MTSNKCDSIHRSFIDFLVIPALAHLYNDCCVFVGYEKYNQIRQDPGLCFLARCGPPDGSALLAEQDNDNDDDIK